MKPKKSPVIADRAAELIGLRPSYSQYEQEKQAWVASHSGATPLEYSAAMLEIAKKCGV